MSADEASRRHFLKVIAQGGAAVGCAFASAGLGGCSGTSLSGSYSGGDVSALSEGSLVIAPDGPLAIGRDSGGVYAMTLICTHSGCDMATDGTVSSSGVSCNCHGSRFDVDGNVTRGPASSPLQHFEVTITSAGAITVNSDVPVSESTRTAVPG